RGCARRAMGRRDAPRGALLLLDALAHGTGPPRDTLFAGRGTSSPLPGASSSGRGLTHPADRVHDYVREFLLIHAHAARLMARMLSTSAAIAAMSRAAGPARSMRLGVAPQSAASA